VLFLRSLTEPVQRLEKKVERKKIVLATRPELSGGTHVPDGSGRGVSYELR
jgi:hypothetical protein